MSRGRPCGRISKSRPGISSSDEAATGAGADTVTGASTGGGGGDAPAASSDSAGAVGVSWVLGVSCASANAVLPSSNSVRTALRINVFLVSPELELHRKQHPRGNGFRAPSGGLEAP